MISEAGDQGDPHRSWDLGSLPPTSLRSYATGHVAPWSVVVTNRPFTRAYSSHHQEDDRGLLGKISGSHGSEYPDHGNSKHL
jgi:hypothetical protein